MQVLLRPVLDFLHMPDLLLGDARLSLTQKLREKRADRDLAQGAIGRRVGLDQTSVSLYEREPERIRGRGVEFALAFFRAYDFTENEALELSREMFRDDMAELSALRFGSPATTDGPKAPHYGGIGAGLKQAVFHEAPERFVTIPEKIAERYGVDNIFVVETCGDSMACDIVREDIPPGSECYFHASMQPEMNDVIAVWLEHHDIGVLKIYRPQSDFVVLQSYNREHRPIIIDEHNPGQLKGVLVGVTREWGRFRNGR